MVKRVSRHLRHHMGLLRQHWRAILLWGTVAFFFLGGAAFLWAATLKIPDLSSLANRKVEQSVKIYDRTGEVLLYDLHQNVQRTVVPLDKISKNVQNATIAIEDPNFYNHSGIELRAIARVAVNLLLPGGISQGGSTITQQVVKLTILTGDKTLTRKFKEWVLALKLTKVLTKDQVLELYLNQVPYGGSVYGVEEAAQKFFGKSALDVSVPEAAYLAAVMPAPTYYSPYGNHREALDARKNLVLSKMLEHGYITQSEYEEAKIAQVEFQAPRDSSIQAPHFVFYVRQYLEDKYGADALEESGWRVITTLDADMQAKAEDIVYRNAMANVEAFNASNMALSAVDPRNGEILAMVGSRDYFDADIDGAYNVAVSHPGRQPGSTFKPFAYAEALLKGYTPDTVLFDVKTQFSTACAPDNFSKEYPCFSPDNYDGQFRGPMTLRNALAQSINVPAVKVLYLAGLNDTLSLAKSMGISTLGNPNQYGLTLVLGGGEVTLLDMTSAYGSFAYDGIHVPTTAILRIEDASGVVIEDNFRAQGVRVLPATVAQQVNDMLSDPIAREPLGNSALNFPGYDVAVKTGTTNNYVDAWTIGYTPNVVMGIWAGNNDNSPMEKRVSGLIVGPAWREMMQYILANTPPTPFSRSESTPTGLKPALRGIWQGNTTFTQNNIEYVEQSVHEILHWVFKNDPNGPVPTEPQSDSQYALWEYPVRLWAQQNGYIDGAQVPVGTAPSTSPQSF